jgi:cysteine-rich repeat protein
MPEMTKRRLHVLCAGILVCSLPGLALASCWAGEDYAGGTLPSGGAGPDASTGAGGSAGSQAGGSAGQGGGSGGTGGTGGTAGPSCGDGTVQAGEPCDDGNAVNEDDCTNACTLARCGDGFTWAGHEQCDDGNGSNSDACLTTCANAACPDGFCNGAETCASCWQDCGCGECYARCCNNDLLGPWGAPTWQDCMSSGESACGGTSNLVRVGFNGTAYAQPNQCWVRCCNYTVYHLLPDVHDQCHDQGVAHCSPDHGGFDDVIWQFCDPNVWGPVVQRTCYPP